MSASTTSIDQTQIGFTKSLNLSGSLGHHQCEDSCITPMQPGSPNKQVPTAATTTLNNNNNTDSTNNTRRHSNASHYTDSPTNHHHNNNDGGEQQQQLRHASSSSLHLQSSLKADLSSSSGSFDEKVVPPGAVVLGPNGSIYVAGLTPNSKGSFVDPSRFRSKMCRHHIPPVNYCPFGDRCVFAHTEQELQDAQNGIVDIEKVRNAILELQAKNLSAAHAAAAVAAAASNHVQEYRQTSTGTNGVTATTTPQTIASVGNVQHQQQQQQYKNHTNSGNKSPLFVNHHHVHHQQQQQDGNHQYNNNSDSNNDFYNTPLAPPPPPRFLQQKQQQMQQQQSPNNGSISPNLHQSNSPSGMMAMLTHSPSFGSSLPLPPPPPSYENVSAGKELMKFVSESTPKLTSPLLSPSNNSGANTPKKRFMWNPYNPVDGRVILEVKS